MNNYLDLLKLILPAFLVEHFELVKSTKENEDMHLYFEERSIVPAEANKRIIIAHGFHKGHNDPRLPIARKHGVSSCQTP